MTRNQAKILMVDDDAEDRSLLRDAFDELHYGDLIHFEENGEKAISYLRAALTNQCVPGLIVLDVNMPRLNGRQTLKWIKEEPALQHINVVIYSTSMNPIEKDECLRLGAHSYVIKPLFYKESLEVATGFYKLIQTVQSSSTRNDSEIKVR